MSTGLEVLASLADAARSEQITVGSSDVAAILALSRWASPGDTWSRLVGLVPRYSQDGADRAKRRGRILEEGIVSEWARENSPVKIERGPPIDEPPIVAPDCWRAMRPDAVALMPDGSVVLVEAKTTRDWSDWGPSGTGEVPLYYAAQAAWQMGVARDAGFWRGIDLARVVRVDVTAYCPLDEDFRTYTCPLGPAVGGLTRHVEQWMQTHVWADVPTPPHLPGLDTIAAIFGRGGDDKKDLIEPDAATVRMHARLLELDETIDAATEEWEQLEAEIKVQIGDAYGIRGVATWARQKGSETVSVSTLRKDAPDLYDALKARDMVKTQSDRRVFRLSRPSKKRGKPREET